MEKTYQLNAWGKTYEVVLKKDTYVYGDNLYIGIITTEGEPYATLTVCLPDYGKLDSGMAFVDTNNFPEALKFIKNNNLGEVVGIGCSGFCSYPLVKFNLD